MNKWQQQHKQTLKSLTNLISQAIFKNNSIKKQLSTIQKKKLLTHIGTHCHERSRRGKLPMVAVGDWRRWKLCWLLVPLLCVFLAGAVCCGDWGALLPLGYRRWWSSWVVVASGWWKRMRNLEVGWGLRFVNERRQGGRLFCLVT